jgi:AraC-like DNA-binding protein
MTPLQYRKHVQLNEARRLMVVGGLKAASASYEVGYGSPTQFSREYRRLFGEAPIANINSMMRSIICKTSRKSMTASCDDACSQP